MDLLPTSIWGVALYVFALFPGIAFIFDHEGHRPVSKRSALRETATVVFVSAICAAVLGVVVAIVAAFWPEFRGTVGGRTGGNLTWALENRPVVTLFAIVTLVLATLLGRLMGSKWAFEKGLEKSTTRTTSSVLVLRRRRDRTTAGTTLLAQPPVYRPTEVLRAQRRGRSTRPARGHLEPLQGRWT
ncbi:DUF6338 family protein [Rathayibacter tanaceti]|uniref:Uncharacterized protein n=1 Tax=Rathayibacter tanaceti TaxID=1671680 RepID=A0A166HG20_9MICO|nr:DUF6338 family protein [Rathayibacter tanaceti]KZX20531.1 hypothetical protein ACH61_02357 [Rathayibacter tanaceti]